MHFNTATYLNYTGRHRQIPVSQLRQGTNRRYTSDLRSLSVSAEI